MTESNRKKGALTPDDLAQYGIPRKPQPSDSSDLKVSDETEKKSPS